MQGVGSAGTLVFVLALFMFGGAKEYLANIKTSRAVAELLMTKRNSEQHARQVSSESAPRASPDEPSA